MENAYGIGVKNRYELFYDEDVDPLEIIRQQEEEKEKRKSDKSHPKDKSKNLKPGKVLPATGLAKKTKEIPVVNQTKPSENTGRKSRYLFTYIVNKTKLFTRSTLSQQIRVFKTNLPHIFPCFLSFTKCKYH